MVLILELEDEAYSMMSNTSTLTVPRKKREERNPTKQEYPFSRWKVLVGPCHWEDYSVNKDGAERYRIHNLPGDDSPGVYELGIAVLPSGSGRGIKSDQIVPVYVGQAEGVRTRLQQYGRSGAHLGKSYSFGSGSTELICKGPDFVGEMLARGYTIVYRWAPTGTKSEALRTERGLLDKLDYAWNRRSNASRRHDDVLQKVKEKSSKPARFTTAVPRHLPFRQKQTNIRIKSRNLISTEEMFTDYADRESRNLIPQVIKVGRSQPRLVLDGSGITRERTTTCGVTVDDGSICRKAPVQRRKRCVEHRGMKNTGSITASDREFVRYNGGITLEHTEICRVAASDGSSCRRPGAITLEHTEICRVAASDGSTCRRRGGVTMEHTEICGVAASDGSTCRRPPVQGRKRCAEHKGKRNSESITASKELVTHKSGNTLENTEICGVTTDYGSICRMPPVPGRLRCDMHKGKRITGSSTASNTEIFSYTSRNTWENTETCGVTTGYGSTCRMPPVPGCKRCAMHKGRRVTGLTANNREIISYRSGNSWDNYTNICGAATCSGSACRRPPAPGCVRCSMHKGGRRR